MFGIVDCNNFYASCERVFNPSLQNKPIVVLSNNDGCVIARSNEAKSIGIKMGVPAFQIQELIKQYDVKVFSSNYTLYGNMSARVVAVLQSFVPDVEVYSIDEAFLDMSGFDLFGLHDYSLKITKAVTQATDIPVSMGIAPTKTLAKVTNKFAKKYKAYNNVCIIDTDEKRIKALQKTDLSDVWGIGRQHAKKLKSYGCNTAFDFAQMPRAWVRKEMTVVGERMWRELNGESCIDLEMVTPPKKEICTSRAFGKMTEDINQLSEAVATYTSLCAQKLRKQKSCAQKLMVFIHTNNFNENEPQYFKNTVITLPVPTNSTPELVQYALAGLKNIYKKGYRYKKAGVILLDLIPGNAIQSNLFDNVDREKHTRIMKVMDNLNSGFNKNVLSLAIQGTQKREWKLKQEMLSPCYTTRVSDIIRVKIDSI